MVAKKASEGGEPQAVFLGEIRIVESLAGVREAVGSILRAGVVGIDTESRPSFRRGEYYEVSLVQVCDGRTAWLFRLLDRELLGPLLEVMESREVLKVGASLRDDWHRLHRLAPFEPHGYLDLQTVMTSIGEEGISVRKMASRLLGVRVSKRQQLSNWESPELTESQQQYAATDAWICLCLYRHPAVQTALGKGASKLIVG